MSKSAEWRIAADEAANSKSRDRGQSAYITLQEIADTLLVSTRSIERWIAKKQFPQPIRVGRLLRWRRSTIENFLHDMEAKAARN